MPPSLTSRDERIITLAEKGVKSPLDSSLYVLDELQKVEDDLASFKDDVEQDFNKLDTKIDVAVKQIKADSPDLDKILASIKGKDATPPTDEELTALIEPLIPTPEDGKTPTNEELLALIKPLIPQVKDGESPSEESLRALIIPLIPLPEAGKDADEEAIISRIENDLPKLGERIRDGLELLQGEGKLDASAVKGIEELVISLIKKYAPQRLGAIGPSVIVKSIYNQSFLETPNGVRTTFTLVKAPRTYGAERIYQNSTRRTPGTNNDYTVAGKVVTFSTAPQTGDILRYDLEY